VGGAGGGGWLFGSGSAGGGRPGGVDLSARVVAAGGVVLCLGSERLVEPVSLAPPCGQGRGAGGGRMRTGSGAGRVWDAAVGVRHIDLWFRFGAAPGVRLHAGWYLAPGQRGYRVGPVGTDRDPLQFDLRLACGAREVGRDRGRADGAQRDRVPGSGNEGEGGVAPLQQLGSGGPLSVPAASDRVNRV